MAVGDGPLAGTSVIDLSRFLPGFAATRLLADAGADVVLVRPPGPRPHFGELPLDELDATLNRGKRSETIDLKTDAGRMRLQSLCAGADVLLEGFRPGVMDRLGFGYAALSGLNPRLIYASLTGYGQTGPYRDMAGHDINYLAMAGVLDLMSPADPGSAPVVPGVQVADLSGGSQQTVIAVLMALLGRAKTGRGRYLDVSMTHGSAWLMQVPHVELARGTPARRGDHVLSGRYACYNVYATKDGRHVAIGALEPVFWAELCRLVQREDLIADQYAGDPRRREVLEAIQSALLQRTAQEWFALAQGHDACLTPVRTLAEALADLEGGTSL